MLGSTWGTKLHVKMEGLLKILRKCQDQEKPGEFELPLSVSFEKLSCVLPDLHKCSHAEMTNNSKKNIFSDLD